MASATPRPIMQVAYVVEDLDAAIERWARIHHVGPFAKLEHVVYEKFFVSDEPGECDISIALAFSGDMQIELIQQHSRSRSIYVDDDFRPLAGFHHLGVVTDDIARDHADMIARGLSCAQRARSATGAQVRYYSGGPSGYMELIQLGDGGAFFARLKQAAEAWDGKTALLR